MKIQKNQQLKQEGKKTILYDLFYSSRNKPLLLFAHGYKGFKDWGAWDLVAERFVEEDINFLKFNFSHNGGTVENPIDFPDLEAFGNNNFSLELEDLDRILNLVTSKSFEIPFNSLTLMGHSRGGGISIIKAKEDSRIDNLVTWASVADFKPRFLEGTEAFEQWKKTGVTYVENSRTQQQLPHFFQFYIDFKANEERLSIKNAAQNLEKPFLIVHGSEDPTVNIKEAMALNHWSAQVSQLEIIPKANHVFGAAHPWTEEGLPKDLEEAVKKTAHFIKTV